MLSVRCIFTTHVRDIDTRSFVPQDDERSAVRHKQAFIPAADARAVVIGSSRYRREEFR